ncbi:MAG TPA: tetraacyldisaccharide 4'-kinase [Rhizomicrobium sp.]|jgi:tetraacyldisaccharide 4'-kinase|nr:tetraacyldisaccharide 4'-kinase [Rhizomicrobium sp.]
MRAPEFWEAGSVGAKLTAGALAPLGWAYGATVALKAANATPYRSPATVICVGNLTVGGTGKTPIVIAITRALMEMQLRVRILTRGYGGRVRGPAVVHPQADAATEIGDEALVLAAAAPVIISANRAAGAKLAETKGVDVIVMDDGHQNFSLAKDLSLVVVDSEQGFGNGGILPAGPLRESVQQGLARADAVVLTGEDDFIVPNFTGPVLRARLVPVDVLRLENRRVVAFAGIGQPEKFFRTLRALGANVLGTHAFADHHVYGHSEMARLRDRSYANNAMLITTEKDFVRLRPSQRQDVHYLPVRAAFDNPAALSRLLKQVVSRAAAVPSG